MSASPNPQVFIRHLAGFQELSEARLPQFRRYFWITVGGYTALLLALGSRLAIETLLASLIISAAALFPSWLWVTGRAKGLPIYPMFGLTALWAYAVPLVAEHPIVVLFPPSYQLIGGVSIAACLFAGALAWWSFVRRTVPPPPKARILPMRGGKMIFWAFMGGALVFSVVTYSGMLGTDLQGFTIIRGVVLGINSLAIFYFGFQHGTGVLSKLEIVAYVALLISTALVTFTGMLLVSGMSMMLSAIIGYVLGSGRVPWRTIAAGFILVSFFHLGKSEQREQYWGDVMWRPVALSEYPSFFGDWTQHSLTVLGDTLEDFGSTSQRKTEGEGSRGLWERSSLMHLFLYFQYSTGTQIPYLWGLTYTVIPELLIPRIFHAEKARAHFGNNVLAVHYGIVENSEETVTSVGFGFINEGYANFGLPGAIGVTAILGALFGWVARMSMSVPLLSFRFLFAVIVLGGAFQVEYTAGVFFSSVFQSVMALAGVALVFMRPYPLRRARLLLSEMARRFAAEEGRPAVAASRSEPVEAGGLELARRV